jgi:hypothetical protein
MADEIQKSPAMLALEKFFLLVHLQRERDRKGYLDVQKRQTVNVLIADIGQYFAGVIKGETRQAAEIQEAAERRTA